jgi:hypothetical protein
MMMNAQHWSSSWGDVRFPALWVIIAAFGKVAKELT